MTTLDDLLHAIHSEALRLHRAEGKPLTGCYGRAIEHAIMVACETAVMEPFERSLVEAIQRAQQAKHGRPVRRSDVMRQLELMGMTSIDQWTVSVKMSALAKRGIVQRPSERLWAA